MSLFLQRVTIPEGEILITLKNISVPGPAPTFAAYIEFAESQPSGQVSFALWVLSTYSE